VNAKSFSDLSQTLLLRIARGLDFFNRRWTLLRSSSYEGQAQMNADISDRTSIAPGFMASFLNHADHF
jgi:hypothetical protein